MGSLDLVEGGCDVLDPILAVRGFTGPRTDGLETFIEHVHGDLFFFATLVAFTNHWKFAILHAFADCAKPTFWQIWWEGKIVILKATGT